MALTKDYGISKEKMCCRTEECCLKEEGDVIRKYKAMSEENFLSSRLREMGKARKKERIMEVDKESKEDTGKKRIREKKEETETVIVERREEISEIGGNSWCDLWDDPSEVFACDSGTRMEGPVVLVVTDVLVSPSSVVTEVCDGFSSGSDWELVELQSLSFSKKRSSVCAKNQGDLRHPEEG